MWTHDDHFAAPLVAFGSGLSIPFNVCSCTTPALARGGSLPVPEEIVMEGLLPDVVKSGCLCVRIKGRR